MQFFFNGDLFFLPTLKLWHYGEPSVALRLSSLFGSPGKHWDRFCISEFAVAENIPRSADRTVKSIFSKPREVSIFTRCDFVIKTEKRGGKTKWSGVGLKLEALGYILLRWEYFAPTGKGADMRVREGGCHGTTCCLCQTVLTAQIREGEGKYLQENHRTLDMFFSLRVPNSKQSFCRDPREWLLTLP